MPVIIILPDTCHLLNNTAKDIGKLEFFLRCVVRNRGHSLWADKLYRQYLVSAPLLNILENRHLLSGISLSFVIYVDIKTGLVAVGDTRFLTLLSFGLVSRAMLTTDQRTVERKVLTLTSCVYSKIIFAMLICDPESWHLLDAKAR